MVRNIPAFRNHWLILAATVVLLVVTLIAGSLFAANDGSNPDAQQLTDTVQVQPDETEPHGIAEPAPAEKTEMPQTDPGSGLNQVASGDSDALTVWLAAQPEVMGPFTVEQAMEADSETRIVDTVSGRTQAGYDLRGSGNLRCLVRSAPRQPGRSRAVGPPTGIPRPAL